MKFYIIKIIDFYNNYFKNYINNELWLDDNVKFYIGSVWSLNSNFNIFNKKKEKRENIILKNNW